MEIKQCSENISISDAGMKKFICGLAKFKYYNFVYNCQQSYCLGPMNTCFGSQLRASIATRNSATSCSASGISGISCGASWLTCFQPDLEALYDSFFSSLCSGAASLLAPAAATGPADAQYLLAVSACYPPGAGIDVSPPNPSVACVNMTAISACALGVDASNASASAQAVARLIYLKYATNCDPNQACAQAASVCFAPIGSFNATDGSNIFTESQLCKAQATLKTCLSAIPTPSVCDSTIISTIVSFIQTTCSADGVN
jgi:hypothetical protein